MHGPVDVAARTAVRRVENDMEPIRFDLEGRTAIVTGAGRGIGRACALALAAQGANVVACSRTQGQIDEVVREIEAGGRSGVALAADVTERVEVEAMVGEVMTRFGRIDILVNNAGVFAMKPLVPTKGWKPSVGKIIPGFDEPFDDDDWFRTINTNVTSVYRCCQAVVPHMMSQGGGRIINIGSIDSEHGLRFAAAYCASKGAVKSMTKAMALEWVGYKITVNCVSPGYVDTDLVPAVMHDEGIKAQTAKANVPMQRFAKPEEVAVPVVWLASDQAGYVTGESIYIDGGVLA